MGSSPTLSSPSLPSAKVDLPLPELAAICAQTGLLLLQHGAESALVESVTRRMGLALGLSGVEMALMANGITLQVEREGLTHLTVRRILDRGINMHVLTEVQRTLLLVEAGQLPAAEVSARLQAIKPERYPRLLVSLMVGLACACFARLALLGKDVHDDWTTPALAFLASGIAMQVRQVLAHYHFNPLVNFTVCSYIATSIAALGVREGWVGNPKIAVAASVLLFVPGFPLINAVSDMVKGYVNTGLSRAVMAMLLMMACCLGIVLAMTTWGVWTWL